MRWNCFHLILQAVLAAPKGQKWFLGLRNRSIGPKCMRSTPETNFLQKVSDGAKLFSKSFRWSQQIANLTLWRLQTLRSQIDPSGQHITWKPFANTQLNLHCDIQPSIYQHFSRKCAEISKILEISTTARQQHLLEVFFWLRMRSIGAKCMRPTPETNFREKFPMEQNFYQKVSGGANISEISWFLDPELIRGSTGRHVDDFWRYTFFYSFPIPN